MIYKAGNVYHKLTSDISNEDFVKGEKSDMGIIFDTVSTSLERPLKTIER